MQLQPLVDALHQEILQRGLLHVIEDYIREQLADGRLVRVFDAWCPSFPGFYLYTANRAQMRLKLRALIDFLKEKRGAR
jgi:DNA-binding transcriptional LysR family regulator